MQNDPVMLTETFYQDTVEFNLVLNFPQYLQLKKYSD